MPVTVKKIHNLTTILKWEIIKESFYIFCSAFAPITLMIPNFMTIGSLIAVIIVKKTDTHTHTQRKCWILKSKQDLFLLCQLYLTILYNCIRPFKIEICMLIIIKLIEHVYIKYFFTTLILFQYNKPFDKDYRHFMEPGR